MPALTKESIQEIFAERLHRARVMRGLSLRELSDVLDKRVSHTALQKYEKGLMLPDSDVLVALSTKLRVRPDFFVSPSRITLTGIEFRKRTVFGRKKQDQVIEAAREYFERYLEIEDILGIVPPPLPQEDLRGTAVGDLGEAVERAAEKLRVSWDLGLGPLASIHELLEDKGVKIKEFDTDHGFDGLSGRAGASPVIVIATWLNEDLPRKRLTVLHELGHLVMRLPADLPKKVEEAACYRFAGAMLLPKEALFEEFGVKRRYPNISLQELVGLKEQWGVSINAVMYRAKELRIITEESHARFCKHASASGLRKDEPGKWVGSESSNRFRQLVHRAAAQELITRSKASGLLGIGLRDFDHEYGNVR